MRPRSEAAPLPAAPEASREQPRAAGRLVPPPSPPPRGKHSALFGPTETSIFLRSPPMVTGRRRHEGSRAALLSGVSRAGAAGSGENCCPPLRGLRWREALGPPQRHSSSILRLGICGTSLVSFPFQNGNVPKTSEHGRGSRSKLVSGTNVWLSSVTQRHLHAHHLSGTRLNPTDAAW